MSVGIEGRMGRSMIREGKGFDVYVRRSLRDIFKKVPTFSLEVKVKFVCSIVALNCAGVGSLVFNRGKGSEYRVVAHSYL